MRTFSADFPLMTNGLFDKYTNYEIRSENIFYNLLRFIPMYHLLILNVVSEAFQTCIL